MDPFGHAIPELLKQLFKLLLWVEEKLPDRLALGWKLLFIGLAALSPLFALMHFPNLDDLLVANIVLVATAGGLCLILGGYILLRHAIWHCQDRRSDRIISIRWK
jgi:hypothetical protein